MHFTLHTDGGCYPNPGPGGWAYIIQADGKSWKQDSGSESATTNNRMEMRAVINGLSSLPPSSSVTLVSDSQYVTKGLTSWRHSWEKNHWYGVANQDLWQLLDELADTMKLEVRWIKGHSGEPNNEACDRMATEAYRGVN